MTEIDKDLLSIQEARTLATQARDAQRKFLHATQAEVDRICAAMAQAANDSAEVTPKAGDRATAHSLQHPRSRATPAPAALTPGHPNEV